MSDTVKANTEKNAMQSFVDQIKEVHNAMKQGLQVLFRKVQGFDSPMRPIPFEPHVEDRFRDHEGAFRGVLQNSEALSVLLVQVIQENSRLTQRLTAMESHMVALGLQSTAQWNIYKDMTKITDDVLETAMEKAKEEFLAEQKQFIETMEAKRKS